MVKFNRNVMLLYILSSLATLTGCSSAPKSASITPTAYPVSESTNQTVKALYNQLNSWHGVPYKLGGTSRKGIDCSAFVQKTFIDQFGLLLPRTTQSQSKIGDKIEQNTLRPGDLVFFKTGFKTRHVGIYVERGKFLHASTSKGVMLSSLSNPYWQSAYWRARRIKQLD